MRGSFVIETSGPSLVSQYDHSLYRVGIDTTGGPTMALVPPLEDRFNDFEFMSCPDVGYVHYRDHYMVIAGDQSIKKTIIFDGIPLLDTGFVDQATVVGGEQLTIGSYRISSGLHHITTSNPPSKGMTILAYGGSDGFAYAYGVGKSSIPLGGVNNNGSESDDVEFLPPFPNPTLIGSTITIPFRYKTGGVIDCRLYDELGREILTKSITSSGFLENIKLDAPLFSGCFYLSFTTGKGKICRMIQTMK